jgi:hypothetical protein
MKVIYSSSLKRKKMKHQFTGVLLCVFVSMYSLLSCTKETALVQEKGTASVQENGTVAATPKMNAVTKTVPFKGTYITSNETLIGPPMQLTRITGIGQSTHLGEGKFVALSTLNLTTLPPFHLEGTAVFYAANGDVFYTTFTGTATPNPDGTRTFVMIQNITGGTGRFEHASGSFTGNGIANPTDPPSGSISYEGSISY